MMSNSRIFGAAVVARVAGAFLISTLGGLRVHAQDAAPVANGAAGAAQVAQRPAIGLMAELKAPLDLRLPDAPSVDAGSSSSSADSSNSDGALPYVALGADPGAADGNGQPPPYRRRRYGSPNYNDRWHNADGSNKLAFVAGIGFTVPSAGTGRQYNLSYSLKGGAGINFSKKLGALVEFNYDRFGVQGSIISQQFQTYSNLGVTDSNGNPIDFSGLDANAYVWSITLNPILTFHDGEKTGAYVVFGGGLYHKVTNFTLPQTEVGFSPFFGQYAFQTSQTFDHYSDNAGGVNAGLGLTYKLSRFSNQKLFAEARYVYVFDSQSFDPNTSLYPDANARTGYFPVTVGLRF